MRKRRILSGLLAAFYAAACMGMSVPVSAAPPDASAVEYTDEAGIVYTLDSSKTAVVTGYKGASALVSISGTVKSEDVEYKVTAVGSEAFKGNTTATNINIPENIETIQEDAFSGCSKLVAVNLPSTLKTIEPGAFKNCPEMNNIVADANNSFVFDENALYTKDKKRLIYYGTKEAKNSYTVPDTVTEIDEYAFYPCTNTSLILNDKIKKLSYLKVADIIIPDGTEKLGKHFLTNVEFRSIVIPETVTEIDKDLVYYEDKDAPALNHTVREYTIKGYDGSYADTFASKMNTDSNYKLTFGDSLGKATYMLKAEIKNNAVQLSWLRTYDADDYIISRTESPMDGAGITLPVTGTSYEDKAVKNDTTYYYRVCAKNADGSNAEPSAEVRIDVTGITGTPMTEINGRVTNYDKMKNRVGKAQVIFTANGGKSVSVDVQDDGRFSFADAEIGTTYTMTLTAQQRCPKFVQTVTAAGSAPVTVNCELRIYGDVTGDQIVDVHDATQILCYEVGKPGSIRDMLSGDIDLYAFTAADVNEDDVVDAKDAALILRYVASGGPDDSYLASLID